MAPKWILINFVVEASDCFSAAIILCASEESCVFLESAFPLQCNRSFKCLVTNLTCWRFPLTSIVYILR